MRSLIPAALCLIAAPALAANLWSTKDSYLGPGVMFGPGALPVASPLFEARISDMAFHSDNGFLTPFFFNGEALPNVTRNGESFDGVIAEGVEANENVELGTMTVAGVELQPFVANYGAMRGEQIMVTGADGNVQMIMELVLDMGIGERGLIKMPFYGTTGTVDVPYSLQTAQGGQGVDQAGPLKSGDSLAGRIGDFNGDGFIDGTLVAAQTMPLDSPIFPGQPFVLIRYFETDVAIDGTIMGSAAATNAAYKAREN
ncbi:MAG: hypothetical protein ACPGNV_06585 [Mangrovicoccus sp.]